jgi:fused signal recognition particle receptor
MKQMEVAARNHKIKELAVEGKTATEIAEITGIILTKLDGTAKGGIAVAIHSELGIPVKYIGVGESIDDLQKFDADQFVNALFDVKNEQ